MGKPNPKDESIRKESSPVHIFSILPFVHLKWDSVSNNSLDLRTNILIAQGYVAQLCWSQLALFLGHLPFPLGLGHHCIGCYSMLHSSMGFASIPFVMDQMENSIQKTNPLNVKAHSSYSYYFPLLSYQCGIWSIICEFKFLYLKFVNPQGILDQHTHHPRRLILSYQI